MNIKSKSQQSPEQNPMMRQGSLWNVEEMSKKLASLVKDKTISQEQANSVLSI